MSQQRKNLLITCIAVAIIVLSIMLVGGNGGPGGRPGAPGAGKPSAGERPAGARPTGERPAGHEGAEGKPNNMAEAPAAAAKSTSTDDTTTVPEIGVVDVVKKSHQAHVTGYGEVSPRFELTLSALVSGRIESLDDRFFTGTRFSQGESLAKIDDTDYRQAVAEAQADLEDAKVALEEERLQGQQALLEWERSGLDGDPESELVLRKPQLAAAEATLAKAERALEQAKRDLLFTEIAVPFNSVVISRDVQPGSFVQAGDDVASLYSTDVAEIAIPLSASQWKNLKSPDSLATSPWTVKLWDMDKMYSWEGVVRRVEQHLDTASRQRNAIVEVYNPLDQSAPLYFGTYVTATINGRMLNDIWQIPSSAISQKQEVWFVREDNTLDKFTPEVLFMNNGFAYILPVTGMDDAKIVVRPLNSYLVNMVVKPVEESTHGDR